MRVCLVCGEYPPGPHGGIGTVTQSLARALVRAGHQVRVIGSCRRDYPGPDRANDEGVDVWRLREPSGRLGWVRARAGLYRTIAAWVRDGALDIVETPDYAGIAAFWPRLGVPVIVRVFWVRVPVLRSYSAGSHQIVKVDYSDQPSTPVHYGKSHNAVFFHDEDRRGGQCVRFDGLGRAIHDL